MNSEELEKHMAAFDRAYKRFPNLPEKRRVEWAEKIASSVALQLIYSTSGPLRAGKYEPADYDNDGKTPLRPGAL